jgi:ABC-type polysaccharide/polyol phosphate transport system ATPase subunit
MTADGVPSLKRSPLPSGDDKKVVPLVELNAVDVIFDVHNGHSRSLQLDILEFVGVRKPSQHRAKRVHALKSVSLQVMPGERVGIVGHNGAGKTTLLRTISGAYPPRKGIVSVRGSVTSMTDFAMGMDPEATGRENIIFRGVFMGMKFREISALVPSVLEFSGLTEFGDFPMRTYSTGMQLRLAFAVSTLRTPDVLVLDEVISAGDLGFRERMTQRLESFIGQSKAVILAAHDLGSLRRWATRMLWLRDGRIHKEGNVDEIIDGYLQAGR